MSAPPGDLGDQASSFDKLTIETPEQLPLEFPLAGVGSRFLALLVDSMIQILAGLAAFVVLLLSQVVTIGYLRSGHLWAVAVMVLIVFVLYYAYFAFFEAIWNGQTPGKRQQGLRVIKENGGPISVFDAVSRNLMRVIDQLPLLYGVGIISVLVSERSQRLGDFVAGTVVVHEKPLEGLTAAWRSAGTATAQPEAAVPRLGAENLTPEEFRVIETFLERRHSLEKYVRDRFAWEIAQRLGAKLNVREEDRRPSEEFLEALVRERRR
ncbi:MAG TPA: RDD family protein [Candidatus Acidoferrales bacterium]|nr:RDD family protein [Candidatus Acidoferrales bacterium]